MNKDMIIGMVRHALTFIGGVLVVTGKGDAELVGEATGAVLTTIGLLWSLFDKARRPAETI